MLTEELKNRIMKLGWEQFLLLILALKFKEEVYSQFWSPLMWVQELDKQIRATNAEVRPTTEAITAALDEITRFKNVTGNVVEELNQLRRQLAADEIAVVAGVLAQIESMRAAKAIHDLIQHRIAIALNLCDPFSTTFPDTSEKRLAALGRPLGEIGQHLRDVVAKTPRLSASISGDVAAANNQAQIRVMEFAASLSQADPAAADPFTPYVVLRSYVSQIPQRMQDQLAIEANTIQWPRLGALAPAGGGESFKALDTELKELISRQGAWQATHNEFAALRGSLEDFFEGARRALAEVPAFAKILVQAATKTFELDCLLLAQSIEGAVRAKPLDKDQKDRIRGDAEKIETIIHREFMIADNRLLAACAELKKVSDALRPHVP